MQRPETTWIPDPAQLGAMNPQAVLPLQIWDLADADHSMLLDFKSKQLGIPPVWMHCVIHSLLAEPEHTPSVRKCVVFAFRKTTLTKYILKNINIYT